MPVLKSIDWLKPDASNPRKADDARLALLRLSLSKLGFLTPIFCTPAGMILSGHQRTRVASEIGFKKIPVEIVDLNKSVTRGINIIFNRATNDFTAFDTGAGSSGRLTMTQVIQAAEGLPDRKGKHFAMQVEERSILGLAAQVGEKYDKKAVVMASNLVRQNIRIPIVVSESGAIVNGVYRLFAARERKLETWPTVEIPDTLADVALNFMNYLSMDFEVDEDFANLMRSCAFRRIQNNRGAVPKVYRFWANGNRTLPDKDSYSVDYWRKFRELHGTNLLDFGAGLCKVAPFLRTKGMDCIDYEPYVIDVVKDKSRPSPALSRAKAREFLRHIETGMPLDSIFMASVLNSIPFPKDRLVALAVVHALCRFETVVYGTCRDISDFHYEYGGIRNANYFVFESESGVRIGDVMHRPKIQKFMTQEEADQYLKRFWNKTQFWPGGNIFYWRASAPKRLNTASLSKALEHQFNLPFDDGTTTDLVEEAKTAFGKRLGVKL